VLGVIDPAPLQLERLAHLHAKQLADDRHQIALVARLHAGDCVAVLFAMKGDSFEDAFEGGHSQSILAQAYAFVKPVDHLIVFWYVPSRSTSHGRARRCVRPGTARAPLTPGFFMPLND